MEPESQQQQQRHTVAQLQSPPARRRDLAVLGAVLAGGPSWSRSSDYASAFENAIPAIKNYTKNRSPGPAPKDLGLQVRELNQYGDLSDGPVLKECSYAPSCFSTTGDPEDRIITTLLPKWRSPPGRSIADAAAELEDIIKAYTPGQNGVDGGGFKIIAVRGGYLYAQFESLKKGRIDDVEFSIGADGATQVRSGTRSGNSMFADKGSNAKRLNYISAQLRERGWSAPEISKDTHPYYFRMNAGKPKVACNSINCKTPDDLVDSE